MSGRLYMVPVGLGDVPWPDFLPQQTRDTTCRLSRFLVENAKTARAELKRIGHPLPLREIEIETLPEPPDPAAIDLLLAPTLQGIDTGLMSEAGCPGVADPGALVARRAHALGITVVPLVGPSSLLLALMASGLDGQRFAFHGYLPAREPERGRRIAELERESMGQRQTQLFIETPYRNLALFDALLKACRASTLLCVATDLTLTSQQIITRSIADWRTVAPPAIAKRPSLFLMFSAA